MLHVNTKIFFTEVKLFFMNKKIMIHLYWYLHESMSTRRVYSLEKSAPTAATV